MTNATSPLIDELHTCGKTLPEELRARIVAEGEAIVPALIAALVEDGEEGDWASIHSVDLLVELKAVAAIGPILGVLTETAWEHVIHDRVVLGLPELGEPVLEPALSMLEGAPAGTLSEALCAIVSNLGVRDDRIFRQLVARFAENPDMGCGWLADYGDERALPLLEREIQDTVPAAASAFGLHPLVDLVDAYERLAGGLPANLRLLVEARKVQWKLARAPALVPFEPASSAKIGRHEPCPCGSGKKYKRCHLGTDDRPT